MDATELDAVVARYDLNQHPFYQAWRAGTLPRAALALYAAEYEPFIGAIEQGWRTVGAGDHADSEREHAGLWASFRTALGATTETSCPEARALAEQAGEAFSDPIQALGALYAFEAQQPSTARSKLDGLRAHYDLPEEALVYFELHAGDYGEREQLRNRIDAVDAASKGRAIAACERICGAMWGALSGILAQGAPPLAD